MADFFVHFVEKYGYFAVFLLAFIDHTGTPGGLLISLGIAIAGYLDVPTVFVISFFGGLAGDLIFYLLGFYGGRRILKKFSTKLDKASCFFDKYGNSAVLWGRFPPLIGKYMMVLSGVCSFPFYKFLPLSILGGLLMVGLYGVPYYFLGNGINLLFESKIFSFYLTVGVLVIHLLIGWIGILCKKRSG